MKLCCAEITATEHHAERLSIFILQEIVDDCH